MNNYCHQRKIWEKSNKNEFTHRMNSIVHGQLCLEKHTPSKRFFAAVQQLFPIWEAVKNVLLFSLQMYDKLFAVDI